MVIIKGLSAAETKNLVRLTLKYPPSTRALLEQLEKREETKSLFESLNPITKYKLGDVTKVIPTAKNWNIL